jgi:hypothetical protein
MLIDNQQVLMDALAISTATTTVSTHKYDTGLTASKVGTGECEGIAFFVDVAADFTTTDETYRFELVSDGDPALGSPRIHLLRTVPASELVAGYKFFMRYDPGALDQERYLGCQIVTGGTTPSITITAVLMNAADLEAWRAYPNNISIS